MDRPLAVLGAGAWGTALAIHVARMGHAVRLWGHSAEHVERMLAAGENSEYLRGIAFPRTLVPTADLSVALSGAEEVLMAVPSQAFRDVLGQIQDLGLSNLRFISAAKGLDGETGRLLDTLVEAFFPGAPFAVLSGPSFAAEVANGKPTAVTVGVKDACLSEAIQAYFHGGAFRIYTSSDITGVQLGGVMKNPLAIAVGISDGLGFGANARSALITRGLAELTRLGAAMGAKPSTLSGLSGLGDLVLTCTDDQSRNRRFGLLLASGHNQDQARQVIGQVVEGAKSVAMLLRLAKSYHVDLPICAEIYAVLHEDKSPHQAVEDLLSRAPKIEGG